MSTRDRGSNALDLMAIVGQAGNAQILLKAVEVISKEDQSVTGLVNEIQPILEEIKAIAIQMADRPLKDKAKLINSPIANPIKESIINNYAPGKSMRRKLIGRSKG